MARRKGNKFPCGHLVTPKNSKPHGPYVNCRTCNNLASKIYHQRKRDEAKAARLAQAASRPARVVWLDDSLSQRMASVKDTHDDEGNRQAD